jgi:Tfp pilus assembly PilM family ATPase
MAQDENTGILGISLIDDQLRIVEGRKSLNEFQIAQITQGRVRQPFNFEVFSDKSAARRFAEDITRLYETQNFEVKSASFSLDSRMVLIKKLPFDKDLSENQLEEHMNWEVRQFIISPIEDYILDFENLGFSANGRMGDMLVVAVRKKVIEFLKEVFKHSNLELKVIDVDLFSAQRALQLNYDYGNTERIGLIDIEENILHILILEGKNYYFSQDIPMSANKRFQDSEDESLARSISKELRRIILDHHLGKSVEDLDEIFLYGEALEDRLLEELQNTHDVRINKANPFKKIKLISQAKEMVEQLRNERFMISVGAALRVV